MSAYRDLDDLKKTVDKIMADKESHPQTVQMMLPMMQFLIGQVETLTARVTELEGGAS